MLVATVNADCEYINTYPFFISQCTCDASQASLLTKDVTKWAPALYNKICRMTDNPDSSTMLIYADPTVFVGCTYIDLSRTKLYYNEADEDIPLCEDLFDRWSAWENVMYKYTSNPRTWDSYQAAVSTGESFLIWDSPLAFVANYWHPVIIKIPCGPNSFFSKDSSCKKCFDFSALNYPTDGTQPSEDLIFDLQARCFNLRDYDGSMCNGRYLTKVKDSSYWKFRSYRTEAYNRAYRERYFPGYAGNEEEWGEQYMCGGYLASGYMKQPAISKNRYIPIDSEYRMGTSWLYTCHAGKYSNGNECIDCPTGYWSDSGSDGADACTEEKQYHIDKYKEAKGCSL